jgi:Sulfotransferase family
MAPTTSEDRSGSKPKVLYVIGSGRSGSTILGVALGNCTDVFFAGELDKWLTRKGEPKLKDAARVEFWSSVRARVAGADVLFGGRAHRYLERSSALFRLGRLRERRRLRAPYRRIAGELYAAVAATAGASCVVDTSHYPLRARELQSLEQVELYLLMLVRDPQDVVASFAKDDVVERRFSPATTRAYLLLTYLLSSWVFLRHPRQRRIVLSYEELIEDPAGVLRELLEWIGSSAEPPDFDSLETGVPLHGNRLLDAAVVSLQQRPPAPASAPASAPAPASASASARGDLAGRLFARAMLSCLGRLRPRVRPRSTRSRSGALAR